MSEEIVNKIAGSGLIQIDLEKMLPDGQLTTFDLKDYLWQGIALKERDFRDALKEIDWSDYSGSHVHICCSEDAIIPTWAYMLVAQYLKPHAATILSGSKQQLVDNLIIEVLDKLELQDYKDARVLVKGCSNLTITESVYVKLTSMLIPTVKSLMFGEACSSVPVYKRKA